jgi:hypothetical protein
VGFLRARGSNVGIDRAMNLVERSSDGWFGGEGDLGLRRRWWGARLWRGRCGVHSDENIGLLSAAPWWACEEILIHLRECAGSGIHISICYVMLDSGVEEGMLRGRCVVRFSPCINKVISDDSFFSNVVSSRRSTQALEAMARLNTWQALKKKSQKSSRA